MTGRAAGASAMAVRGGFAGGMFPICHILATSGIIPEGGIATVDS